MKMKKKNYTVNVEVLEAVGDGDRYLVRYHVPELGLQAVEWVSLAGVKQWLNTSTNTTVMNAIMRAIEKKIEETQKEVQNDASKVDSDEAKVD